LKQGAALLYAFPQLEKAGGYLDACEPCMNEVTERRIRQFFVVKDYIRHCQSSSLRVE